MALRERSLIMEMLKKFKEIFKIVALDESRSKATRITSIKLYEMISEAQALKTKGEIK